MQAEDDLKAAHESYRAKLAGCRTMVQSRLRQAMIEAMADPAWAVDVHVVSYTATIDPSLELPERVKDATRMTSRQPRLSAILAE